MKVEKQEPPGRGGSHSDSAQAWPAARSDLTNTPSQQQAAPPEADEFSGCGPALVLRRRPATSVYFNGYGDVVISQERWPEEDEFVYIEVADVPAVVAAMMRLIEEAGS